MSAIEPFVVRRRTDLPLPDVASDPELVRRIRAEILAAGPMTFARFMELALYDPEHGYYSSPEPRPTREGDFLTAPELHPIFGRTLARAVVEVWQRLGAPTGFTIREYGAGSGALAEGLLEAIRADEPDLMASLRYEPVEHNRHRLADLRARLEGAGFGEVLASGSGPLTGVVLANEFLDALPVHLVEGAASGDTLVEVYVDVPRSPASADAGEDRFVERLGPASTPALGDRIAADGEALAPGQRAEVRLADAAWVAELGRDLERGVAIVVDYGLEAADLYDPRRGGTLLAYLGHQAHGDPFRAIGRQDLTAHVDLTALRAAAAAARLDVLGETSHAEFLVGSGLEVVLERTREDPRTDLAAWAAVRAAVGRLLDPRALGAFRVVVVGRGVAPEPPLSGLAFRTPRPPAAGRPTRP